MTEDFNEIKPGAQAVAESVTRKRAALEAKHIILTDRPEDVAAYLPKYHYTMHEIIEIGPWQSYGAFREGAGRNMTRLFLSDEARVACAEQLSRLTDVQKRASYLFSYEDAADWIHRNSRRKPPNSFGWRNAALIHTRKRPCARDAHFATLC